MNSHSFLICGVESIFFYNVKKWFCFYLNFSFYLSASQPGRQGATSKGGLNIQVCTCSLKGHEVCNVKIKQRLCLKKNLCRSGWSVVVLLLFSFLCLFLFMVLAFVAPVQVSCLSVNTFPRWALLLRIISKGIHLPGRQQNKVVTWLCHSKVSLTSFYCFSMTMCNFAECECGDRMIFSKTERFHDLFAKSSPIWIFGMTPLFCLFSWRKLSPKLVILPAICCCICSILRPPLSICVW